MRTPLAAAFAALLAAALLAALSPWTARAQGRPAPAPARPAALAPGTPAFITAAPGMAAPDTVRAGAASAGSAPSAPDSVLRAAPGAEGEARLPAAADPLRGVVWSAPERADAARADLRRVRAAGFSAVRTHPLSDALLAEAGRHGLAVFVDLPLDYPTASDLADARPALLQQITALGRQARAHPALTHVGLARRANTRDAAVCRTLRALADAVRAQRLVPYLVAAYGPEDGACAAVPLVLLDRTGDAARGDAGRGDLAGYGADWPAVAGGVRLGYLVGRGVVDGRSGVFAAGSPERQARALAEALRTAPAPVFVVQWRDGGDLGRDNPRRARFGLYDADDTPRLAARVAADVLRGGRDAFVYAGSGTPARPSRAPTVWLWAALLLAGIVMATEPRLRTILPRFVRSPAFFRDSVRDARGTMVGATLGHWVALCLFVGVFVTTLVRIVAPEPSFAAFLAMLPEPLGRSLAAVLDRPALAVALVALLFAVLTGVWAYGFVLAARRRYHLSLWQAVMLIVWHRWLVVPLAVLALALLPDGTAGGAVLGWALAFAAVEVWGAFRSALDLVLMTRLPVWIGGLLLLLPPFTLGLLGLLWFRREDLAFLMQL